MASPRGSVLEAALFAVVGGATSSGAPFATDGGELERAGIASLICGPGELEQAHQPNESMSRAAFEDGADVILSIVRRLCTS
jgi:acetylornithine deacetylase